MTRVAAEHLARGWPIYAEAAVLFSVPVAVMLDMPTWATAAIGIAGFAALISVGAYYIREWRERRGNTSPPDQGRRPY
jgi:hypothetical protein